jgi:hypothetical protein
MKTYDILTGFWHAGQYRAKGTTIDMNPDVAKYLEMGGTIKEAAPKAPAAEPAAEPVPA